MAGVVFDQVKLSLAAFEDGVMGDVAPFVIAGPAGDSLGDVAGQKFAAAHMIHMAVQRNGIFWRRNAGRTVGDRINSDAQFINAIDIAVSQSFVIELVLHQVFLGIGVVVDDEVFDHMTGLVQLWIDSNFLGFLLAFGFLFTGGGFDD